ncbi:MAG: hypothetical protein ACJAWS_001188 [Oleiphilaceae bacterium]|jgi:hypothetical protein
MKNLSLSFAILLSASSVCHAGFFDSLFGSDDPAPKETVQVPADTDSTMKMATDIGMSLIPLLTQQLGVTDTQAEGGMGSLLQVAKDQLTTDEFSELGQGVPDITTLLAAAPNLIPKGVSSKLPGGLSGLGGLASSIGGISQLTSQFEALGLSPDMIGKFASIAIDYFSSSSSESSTSDLLQKGLSAILK